MLVGSDENSDLSYNETRNSVGGIVYSEKRSFKTSRIKDDKMSGWIDDDWKDKIKAGDRLVAFHPEQLKKFYVIVEGTSTFDKSASGVNPKHGFSETVTYLDLTPFREIDVVEGYRGRARPHQMLGYRLDFPNRTEHLEINNIPTEGLPLGDIESSGSHSTFSYPLKPEDTIFQSMVIDGPQGKGKTNLTKLLISSINSKTNYAQIIIDREGEYTNFTKLEEMADEGRKFFTKHGIKPVKPQVIVMDDNDRSKSTATMSMKALDFTQILMLSNELPPASARAAEDVFQVAKGHLLEKKSHYTFEELREQVFYELDHSSYYQGGSGKEIKNAIQRALTAAHLGFFDQPGKIPLTPENLVKENSVIVIDAHTLSPARLRMLVLYLILVLQKYKFEERHDEPGVLLYFDESEYIFPMRPGTAEKAQVQRLEEMLQEPVNRGRKHKYGIISITHAISRLSTTLVDLCNTKVVFGRIVSSKRIWFNDNIGKDRTKELGFLEQGQCIIDTRQTAVPINAKVDIPFIGKDEDYFG